MKRSVREYYHHMIHAFTGRFLLLMFVVQCFINGIVFMTIIDSMFPLLKSMGVDPSHLQILRTLAMAPWSLKPLMGVVSDIVSLGRYHKRYWMILSCGVGIVGASILTTGTRDTIVLVMMFFCVNFQASFCDLLLEGKYAELMNADKKTGSNIVTLKTGFQQLGFLAAMGYVGPLADEGKFTTMYVVALCFAATPVIPLLLGWLPETKVDVRSRSKIDYIIKVSTEKLRKEWRMILFVSMIGLSGPCVSLWMVFSPLENVQLSRIIGLSIAGAILLFGVIGGYCAFPRTVGHIVLYQVATSLVKVDVGTALDFFYTASDECLPGGPHFPYKYYITLTGVLSTCVGVLATIVYQLLFSRWKLRNVIVFTTLLSGVAAMFDVAMVLRWNIWLGIPDKTFYVVGEAILEKAVGMLLWIPTSTIIAKVCPEGMEASTYAYLAGMSNFAGTVSSISGAMAIDWALLKMNPPTLTPLVYTCNWDNLWILVLVGHVILPTVGGLLFCPLIPNKYQTDSLVDVVEVEEDMELIDTTTEVTLLEEDI